MSYLTKMTDEELQYICDVIPYEDVQGYFRHNPKQFGKIRPGFRVTSVTKDNAAKILYATKSSHFVSSFLEKHISIWLSEIEAHISACMEDGDSLDMAYAHTLPHSFFSENYSLFFKLIEKEKSEDYLDLLRELVLMVSKEKERSKHDDVLMQTNTDSEPTCIAEQTQIINMLTELLSEKEQECADLTAEVQQTRTLRIALSSERSLSQLLMDDNDALSDHVNSVEETLAQKQKDLELLEDRLAEATQELREAEIRLAVAIQEKQDIENATHEAEAQGRIHSALIVRKTAQSLCPERGEEFKEYLGYNLQSIGVPMTEGYFDLLIDHVFSTLFCGMPILISSAVGHNIARCVANALIGAGDIDILPFTEKIGADEIKYFLNRSGRIVLFDGFIGNYNEMQLLPIVSQYRDKIIFLTFSYERTLQYIPVDFLIYCQYLNVNRVGALSVPAEITEDPSTFKEHEISCRRTANDNRFQKIGREIMQECGFTKKLIERLCLQITNEQELCQILMFSILPYCADVLGISPYNVSQRLQKYAGQAGRCPHKALMLRWFESE